VHVVCRHDEVTRHVQRHFYAFRGTAGTDYTGYAIGTILPGVRLRALSITQGVVKGLRLNRSSLSTTSAIDIIAVERLA